VGSWLLRLWHRVCIAVIENKPFTFNDTKKFDSRVSAINHAAQKIFQAVDVWPSMQQMRVNPFQGMEVWDAQGHGRIHFDSLDIGESNLGHIIENRVMLKALTQQLSQKELIRLFPQPKSLIHESDNAILELEDGTKLRQN
jgi:2-octaprenylphenol hydroxylase